MSKRTFTINLYGQNCNKIERVLKILNREAKGSSHIEIQVILLDKAGDKKNAELVENHQEHSGILIQYVNCEGLTTAQAYNLSKETWTGEYVTFITENMTYEKGALSGVSHYIRKYHNHLVCLTPRLIDSKGQNKAYLRFHKQDTTVDLLKAYFSINMNLNSFFIHYTELLDVQFRQDLLHQACTDVLFRLFSQCGHKYGIVNKNLFIQNELETDVYNYPDQYAKTWYTKEVQEYIIPTLKKATHEYEKYGMLYLLMIKFACNRDDKHKQILLKEEVDEFLDQVKEALQYIPDSIISQYEMDARRVLPRFMGLNLLRLKYESYDEKATLRERKGALAGVFRETVIERFRNIFLKVKAINYEENNLVIEGELFNSYFLDFDQIRVTALVAGTIYEGVPNQIYSLTKFFNKSVQQSYTFSLTIPVKRLTSTVKFDIKLEYMGHAMPLDLRFHKIQSRIYEKFQKAYWCFGNHILRYNSKTKQLIIMNKKPLMVLKNEIVYNFYFVRNGKSLLRSLKCLLFRLLYWTTRPFFYKKQIWLTYDQMFKGGDNGEYFYRYVSERKDKGNIKIYYVINKNAPEYSRLKKQYGTVLVFNSLWHKLISLHSTVIFATRVDVALSCGYWAEVEKYVRDLFRAEVMCLQHGLTIQRIAQYQNRLHDNIKLYFCVSPKEIENLSRPIYGYEPRQLILTGAPRYDGLINEDKRFILISPTWRRNVTAGTNKKGQMHVYYEDFKNTEYFKIYNALINNKKLLQAAKENKYQIKYLIHPVLSQQSEDFDANEYVDIVAGAGDISYEKMLKEASLMVTDYSGIQFDFATMRKPLVYYHPETLPPQYEEGGLEYANEGFGPVCKQEEQVVDVLCEYMNNNCKLEEKYENRISRFFTYHDTDNCKRVYEAVVKHLKL